jgi:hypothetical protein
MAFKLIQTTIADEKISMRYVDDRDPQESIDFQVNIANLRPPVADSQRLSLGVLQRAALEYVRDFLSKERQSRANLKS